MLHTKLKGPMSEMSESHTYTHTHIHLHTYHTPTQAHTHIHTHTHTYTHTVWSEAHECDFTEHLTALPDIPHKTSQHPNADKLAP